VAPLEMNAGTCWGKNRIGPRARSVEKAPGSDFTLLLHFLFMYEDTYPYVYVLTRVKMFSNEPSKIPRRRAPFTTKIHNTILSDVANIKLNKN
jgi:hypothetical protein